MNSTPVFLSDPHKDVAPRSYVLQVDSFRCSNCNTTGSSCEVFARTWFKGQWGKPYSNLRPMKNEAPKYNLPVEVIHRQVDIIPFCHHCPNPSTITSKLPYPPVETKTAIGAGFREAKPPSSAERQTKKKPVTTTDDLMKDLDL